MLDKLWLYIYLFIYVDAPGNSITDFNRYIAKLYCN